MGVSVTPHTQNKRLLRLATPLGDDVLVPLSAEGEEVMSAGFSYGVTAFSEARHDLQPRDLVGKPVTLVLIQEDESKRYFNGYVAEFRSLGRFFNGQRSKYQFTLRPWLHFLEKSADCRIFQNLSVPDVLKQVFKPLGEVAKFTFDLKGSHEPYRYLTQFNETSANFVLRLLRMDGIGFVIEQDNGAHSVRFFDDPATLPNLAPESELKLQSTTAAHDHLQAFSYSGRFVTGRFSQRSYNYKQPGTVLQAQASAPAAVAEIARTQEIEQYYYTGTYSSAAGGKQDTGRLMGRGVERHQVASGHGGYRHLKLGQHFTVKQVPEGEWVHAGQSFTFTRLSFSVNDASGTPAFAVRFKAVPKGEMLYPEGERPLVASLQTAVVTGPKGEEIFTDALGRIKVRFHWDRDGKKKGEESTCWLRVMQAFAGAGFGAHFTPRIGQEVVVAFESGDPDRPFVLGALYHAEHQPPYAGKPTQSGIRTRSTKQGGASNCNEIRFDDQKGGEQLFVQAEKNLDVHVKANESRKVGKKLRIHAGDEIELVVGGSSIKITGGKIQISSATVEVEGSSLVKIAGGAVQIN